MLRTRLAESDRSWIVLFAVLLFDLFSDFFVFAISRCEFGLVDDFFFFLSLLSDFLEVLDIDRSFTFLGSLDLDLDTDRDFSLLEYFFSFDFLSFSSD